MATRLRSSLLLVLLLFVAACTGSADSGDGGDGLDLADEVDLSDAEVPEIEVTPGFCEQIATILDTVSAGSDGPEALESSFVTIDQAFAEAQDLAPAGTEDTLAGARAFFGELDAAAAAVGYDNEQVPDEVFTDLEAEYGEDVETMEAYFAACELDGEG
ncbi:hypothetical protein [Euzebya tangerina]|uniref:hypothetical protein n=1 Tax=Euzebya tangerina TaxID=591198 RepID=UPI000E3241C7|nr:hypothetical protein [Euzebya tangerina]